MNDNKKIVSFDKITDSFMEIGKRIHSAKRGDLRVPKEDVDLLLQFAVKHYNIEAIKAQRSNFSNAYNPVAERMCNSPDYAYMTSEEKTALRWDIMAEAKLLDYICEISADNKLDSTTMRSALTKTIGSYLYMIHGGNMENVKADLAQLSEIAGQHAKNFGASLQGWEQLFKTGE